MEVKISGTCTYWSQHLPSQSASSSSSSHTPFASAISSTSTHMRNRKPPVACRIVHSSQSSSVSRRTSINKLSQTQSFRSPKSRGSNLRRPVSSSDEFFDDGFSREIQELALKLNIVGDNEDAKLGRDHSAVSRDIKGESSNYTTYNSFDEELAKMGETINNLVQNSRPFPPLSMNCADSTSFIGIGPNPIGWAGGLSYMNAANIEMKASSADIPLSLRILRRKNQWKEGFKEAGGSACCSIKKAFSSMVFILRELHSYTLQMRELLYYEDLQGILARVHREMHDSFVWLFQQIFSHTPTLMVSVMILMANFIVHSMAQNAAIAAYPSLESYSAITEIVSTVIEDQNQPQDHQDESALDTSSSGKTTFLGGNKGGGGNVRSITGSGADGGDGGFHGFSSISHHNNIAPDEISKMASLGNPSTSSTDQEADWLESDINQDGLREDEMTLWNSVVKEASQMQQSRDSILDHETMRSFVSLVKVETDSDFTNGKFFRTELIYQQALLKEPHNALLLANYAKFLHLVVHNHDRAEEYFKRAADIEPVDAELLSHYATFLWTVKKDIGAAEERYLEAIEADPGNMFHASSYANFLWNTGGVDTCFPLGSLDENEA
ncbi:hypothetical protein C5167_009741 [Papaver somniferum]|uniref:Uncharacterized protein n=1 Tax=Papaver somniferum TaxID=3469 RepID=A0A4Y7JY83_PAPSO|nr:uncharacterized protein LOC113288349 [Papaver somniferum]RZC66054.1 hypothetical protein C5167_009741 [Papaver somniferum]